MEKVFLKIIKNNIKKYINSVKLCAIFFGFKFYCPFCKKSLRKLLPRGNDTAVTKNIIGMGLRECYCPFCYSTDRERLLFIYLKRKTNLFNDKEKYKLLHFAPEKNLANIIRSKSNIDYLTADLYMENVMMKVDVSSIPFNDNYFDIIICNHVLEHVQDDLEAMKELYRVLKPNGWGILQVPISYSLDKTFEDPRISSAKDRIKYYGQKDHVRIYGLDYTKRLEKVGFKIKIINPKKEFGDFKIKFLGLISNEKIFVVNK